MLLFLAGGLILSSCSNKVSSTNTAQNIQAADSITLVKLRHADSYKISITNNSNTPSKFYLTPARYNFQSYQTLLADIIKPGSTDKEKAIAIWRFTESWTYHSVSAMQQRLPHDPLRLFNSFESGLCDDRNAALTNIFLLAGLKAHAYHLEGHVVAEVFYENGWHMYDADWNLYFKDDNGNVASVEYISNHPEAICKERSSGGDGRVKFSLGMQMLKWVYTTKANNHIGNWYTDIPLNYNNIMQLAKGDELSFNYSKADMFDKFGILVAQHAIHNVKRKGILSRRIVNRNTTRVNADDWVMAENLPYGVQAISMSADNSTEIEGDIKVYYSPDGTTWYYKGVITAGFSNVSFNVFDIENQPVAFNYFIKLSGKNVKQAIDKSALVIENNFLFSDKLFLNADNAFKLVYLQPQTGKYLNVNCKAENEQ
jgi:hypothetical protein